MVSCAHGFAAPDEVITRLPICQAGEGRHRCAVCAYGEGLRSSQGLVFAGPAHVCDQDHASAPADMLKALPISQAGPQRHRCVYQAFQEGRKAGLLIGDRGDLDVADEAALVELIARTDVGPTDRMQLMLARRGQGVFRNNVMAQGGRCRVTGTTDPRFLIASHMKPWRDGSDAERLDGCNGLMLAPHVDHLFDKGWFTFAPDGGPMPSSQLPAELWQAWGLGDCAVAEPFTVGQWPYLDYHRTNIFRA